MFAINRADGYGGVAIMVKNNILAKLVPQRINLDPIETIEVDISINNISTILSSIYIPPNVNNNNISSNFSIYIDNLDKHKNVIFGGDINALHPLWDKENRENARGKILANKILQSNFHILNNGQATRQNLTTNTQTAIDISGASAEIARNILWEVLDETNLGSDHLPILLKFQMDQIDKIVDAPREIIDYKKLEALIPKIDFNDTTNIMEFENRLINIISGHTKVVKRVHKDKPWWTEKIKRLWLIKQEKQKIYNKCKTPYTASELKKTVANLRQEINISKRNSWNKFTEEIKPQSSLQQIYKQINIIKNKNKHINNTYLNSEDKLKNLLNINYIDPIPTNINIHKQINDDRIECSDITDIIKNNGNSAGGLNKLNNRILKLLNVGQIEILTTHLQTMWNTQDFPETWNKIKAIAFAKPNKPKDDLSSYRIISLLNVLHKLFNKIIKHKLNLHIEVNNLLPADSYGFRKGVGIQEFGVRLTQILEANTRDKLCSLVIAIDVTKAFDKINIKILIAILRNMNIEEKYIYWIYKSIYNREITITNHPFSAKSKLKEGVPQGDVLSPLLFNLYTSTIHEIKDENTELLQYADDFTLIVKDINPTALNLRVNNILGRIKNKLEQINFELNSSKCSFMSVNCPQFFQAQVYLDQIKIKEEQYLKILGINYDKKLNFKSHNREIKNNAYKYLNVLKVFNYKRGGAHPKSMLNVHNALVKSHTTFAAAVTYKDNKQNNKTLQVIHNESIRICLGLTKTTPITAILGEAAEWPVELTQKYYTVKFIAKHLCNNTNIGQDIRNMKSTNNVNSIFKEFPILNSTPVINNNITLNNNNLTINCDIRNYNNNQQTIEKRLHALDYIQTQSNKYQVYTDGSKTEKGVGIGIYFIDTMEGISKFFKLDLSIKTTEIIAIFLAIKLAMAMNKTDIIIYTDSRSACKSIKSYLSTPTVMQYYENRIIHLVNKFSDRKVKIQWIPAHVGIPGNESADKLAGRYTHTLEAPSIEPNVYIPIQDALRICKNIIHNTWIQQFKHMTEHKGTFHKSLIVEPKTHIWFKNTKLNSTQLKQILRLRSGHAFNKKHLHMINLTNTDTCDTCNTQEDTEHIILHCTQYINIRRKYPALNRLTLTEILKDTSEENLIAITSYLNEIKCKL